MLSSRYGVFGVFLVLTACGLGRTTYPNPDSQARCDRDEDCVMRTSDCCPCCDWPGDAMHVSEAVTRDARCASQSCDCGRNHQCPDVEVVPRDALCESHRCVAVEGERRTSSDPGR